jgi:hypothetical protein
LSFETPSIDALGAVRTYRDNYVNFHELFSKITGVPDGVTLLTPDEQPILELDLLPGVRDAMDRYQQLHPKATLTPLKFMRMQNGALVLIVEDAQPLPAEQDLVSFSCTVTTTSTEAVVVSMDQLVATLDPSAASSSLGASTLGGGRS